LAVTASKDKTIKLWNLGADQGKECLHTFEGHKKDVKSIKVSHGIIASGGADRMIGKPFCNFANARTWSPDLVLRYLGYRNEDNGEFN